MLEPVHYTDQLADEICSRLGDGETLSQICRDKHMPTRRAVFYWVDDKPAFASMYATARLRQAEMHYDELMEAARHVATLTDTASVQAYRVYIDTLKWAAARLRPEVYAEPFTRASRPAPQRPETRTRMAPHTQTRAPPTIPKKSPQYLPRIPIHD